MWGQIIGAGVSGLLGLFGKKKEKKQETTTRINYGEMVADARAAGFNPLTALRNGGSAGFTTTTAPTVSQLPEALSNFGGVLGQALGDKLDPILAKKREPDTALLSMQISDRAANAPGGLFQPRTYTGTKVSRQLVPRLGATSHKQTASVPGAFKSDMGYDEGKKPSVTNPYPKGAEPDPNTPNASDIEDRLGDDLLSPAFWYVAPRDMQHNIDRWFEKRGLPVGPDQMGHMIRRSISDWWNKPRMPRGLMRNGRAYPAPPGGGARTRSGVRF